MSTNLRELVGAIGRLLKTSFSLSDCVFFAAAAALGYGLYQIHQPLAYIVLGILFIVLTTYGRFK